MPVKKPWSLATFVISFVLVLAVLNCGNQKRKYLIPQDRFVDVLVDIHLADAIALNNNPQYTGFALDSAELYESVFSNHSVTRAQFDSTISYYSSRHEEFQLIYNQVSAKLNLLYEEMLKSPTEE
ncbi:MAG: DUF4296 domain-containing protein [Bacteroidales bacterium]|nr:DUF4296 domain-containing protein [Bacteroidales bacterium]